jgi:hypothetical protein
VIKTDYTFEIAIVVFAYLLVIMGAYFIRLMLRRYEKEVEISGLKGAGTVIGIVERVMVLTFVLVNQYTAITVIFVAKSIARFNELKDRKMAEYRDACKHNLCITCGHRCQRNFGGWDMKISEGKNYM